MSQTRGTTSSSSSAATKRLATSQAQKVSKPSSGTKRVSSQTQKYPVSSGTKRVSSQVQKVKK